MRRLVILALLATVLGGYTLAVFQKERQLANGTEALLRLAPVDPRALLMGDYMTLEYALNRDIQRALEQEYGRKARTHRVGMGNTVWPASGRAVIRIPKSGEGIPKREAQFVRLDNGVALESGEAFLVFRVKGWGVTTASMAYYFQEGHGKVFESAVYGRVLLDANGKGLLVALCDAEGKDILQKKD